MANKNIKLYGVDRQYQSLKEEILDITDTVLSSGILLDGKYTEKFELEVANRCDRLYAVAVNSATTGLFFSLIASLSPAKSPILLPAVSYVATINSVLMSRGYNIKFCDVDQSALINLDSVQDGFSDIGLIMYANLFGNTVDWGRFQIMSKFFGDAQIIEDAAQSFGAIHNGVPSGKMGDISVFSFDPTKNLNNYGSGGMVLTDNPSTASYIMDLRNNGKQTGHELEGLNARMSELDCAIMSMKLKHVDKWQTRRTEIADYYTRELQEFVDVPLTTPGTTHAWSKYVIRVSNRHMLAKHLNYNDIETKITYSRTLYEEFVGQIYSPHLLDTLPAWESEKFTRECLSLPIYPELLDSEVEKIVNTVKDYFR